MKIKDGYLMREVAGEYILFPVGQSVVDSRSIVRVNESGKFLVEHMMEEIGFDELVELVAKKHEAVDADMPRIRADVDFFMSKLRMQNLLIE